ncbi:C6 finger domain-containing protein [Hypoxylon trugodes]|uniref:C6 finger domain-containing protein n=1 Tax=Hypoxylon trugodes TaxID=326681 RepID=UPI00219191A2|nr:C6 finger domain-containing protein [Hypoxylon trugodes]KAI1384757.1 C6 finger domain-containing protein [Hypoxylon trugodes]
MMASGTSPSSLPRQVPKLGHKKSMFGCQRCRQRRVKCNEAKPICHNCKRHGLPCVYDRDASVKSYRKSSTPRLSPSALEENDPPESRVRRMIETKLMHQYLVETGSSIAADDQTRGMFAREVPRLSFDSDALLYSMYTVSAMHFAKLGKNDELADGAVNAASKYFSMAVREHNKEVSQVSRATADLVCLTSCLMRIIALVQLQGRSRQPWQWLALAQTSTSTFIDALDRVGPDPNSAAYKLIQGTAHLHVRGKLPNRKMYQRLQYLMERPEKLRATEHWDSEIQVAYERVLEYICTALGLMDKEGPSGNVFRMLLIFPMLVDRRFVELVQTEVPRARVILAHYFALLVQFDHIWWIGDVGANEVRTVASEVPDEWQGMLVWPLKIIEK